MTNSHLMTCMDKRKNSCWFNENVNKKNTISYDGFTHNERMCGKKEVNYGVITLSIVYIMEWKFELFLKNT